MYLISILDMFPSTFKTSNSCFSKLFLYNSECSYSHHKVKLSVPVQLDITIVSSPIYCIDNHPSTTLARGLHRGQSSRSGTEQRHREAPKALIDRKLTLICMFMFGHNCSLLFNQTTEYLN